jgi:polyphosphate glucokinase
VKIASIRQLQSRPQALQFLQMATEISTPAAPPPAADSAAPVAAPLLSPNPTHPVTLAIDIGGSGLKAMLLDADGKSASQRLRIVTPAVPTPEVVLTALDEFRAPFPDFDRVSVGFPGIVKRGVTILSTNLHPDWSNFPLQDTLSKRWNIPVCVGNDADIAGYGAIQGQGVELVLTLGTGLGSALFTNGHLVPGLELSLHPWRKKGMNYEDYLGRRGLDKYGKARWNDFLEAAIHQTELLFNWDHLYLGGGNTKKITFKPAKNVTIVSNESGLLGGVFLWKDQG